MIPASVTDQADGLRRLMTRHTARRVAVVGSPDGGVALNLAAALAQQGREVQLLDEHAAPQPAPRPQAGGLLLVNAAPGPDGALSPLAAGADQVLVVFQANALAVTQAYLCIKQLHQAHALRHFRVLASQADDPPAQARRLMDNLALTASRYLGVGLQAAGFVRADPRLAQAAGLGLAVVQAFSNSPAAQDFCRIAMELPGWPAAPALPAGPSTPGPAHAPAARP